MMRFLFFLVVPFLLIACSKDKPAPVAPASKAQAILEAPAAPTNLRFDAPMDSSCTVRWDASHEATDYDVNYKPAVGGRWTNEPHRGIGLSNTIDDLQPNTEYRWAVRAENSDGSSEWIHGPNFITRSSEDDSLTNAPAALTNLRVEDITETSVRVAWDTAEGATDYDVNYKPAVGGKWKNSPHRGTHLYNVIEGLEPNTEYRWAVRAESPNGPSKWVFGERFTTKAPYIRPIIESSLTVREEEIFLQALVDWEDIIVSGHPDGLTVYAFATTRGNHAAITEFSSYNGYEFPTHCQISLTTSSQYWRDREDSFRWSVLHELGHCLGIGSGNEWNSRIETRTGWFESGEYEVISTNEDGTQTVRYEMIEGPIQPHFIGDNARETFMRLSENQWEVHPYVPLNWDRWNGSDSSHVDDPILWRSIMASSPADYGNMPFQKVSSIEASFLKDMGYETVEDVEDILLIGGFADVNDWNESGGYGNVAHETLFFPQTPLDFRFLDHHGKGYRPRGVPSGRIWGDPTIRIENIFWWHDESYAPAKRVAKEQEPLWCMMGKE